METKNTPGPWNLDDDGFIYAVSGGDIVIIADPCCSKDIDISERGANAQLITAAPELLDALIKANLYIKNNLGMGNISYMQFGEDAIKKATTL